MIDPSNDTRVSLLRLLVSRLERLSVDSLWARRASGTRGSLLKALESIDAGQMPDAAALDVLIEQSFLLLRRAAQEIPDANELRRHR